MIDRIKKLPDVAFQHPYCFRMVARDFHGEFLKSLASNVHALSFSGRVRIINESFIEFRFKNPVYGVVQNSIPHARLVYVSSLRITDSKCLVRSVNIVMIREVIGKRKKLFFKIFSESQNISLSRLAILKFSPCGKKIFLCYDFLMQTTSATPPPRIPRIFRACHFS